MSENEYDGTDRRQPENAEKRRRFKMVCTEHCSDHQQRSTELSILQQRITSFEDNYKNVPETLSGLSGRFRLMIWLLALMLTSTITGVIYSFNAVNSFKDAYAEDQRRSREKTENFMTEIRTSIFTIRDDMNKSSTNMRDDITEKVDDLKESTDSRLDDIEKAIIELDGKIKLVEQKGKNSKKDTE